MAFNYDKLKGKIVEFFGSQYRFAEAMGMSERTLSLKLNGNVPWKQRYLIYLNFGMVRRILFYWIRTCSLAETGKI